MSKDRNERTIKEIIEYLKIQNGNCSNELSNVEGLCLVNYIEWLENRIDKAIEYIEKQKPLSLDETRQKEQLKLAYKNSDIFKTLCHLEDLEIALWEVKDILKEVELTENDKNQIRWLKEEFKVGVDKE